MTVEKAIDKLQKLSKLTSSKEPCEMAINALRSQQRLFTRAEVMALVNRIFAEIRNGQTTPTLGAVEWRLDDELEKLEKVGSHGNPVLSEASGSAQSAAQK